MRTAPAPLESQVPAARVYTREAPPPMPPAGALAGRRVLFLVATRGHALQETLPPADLLTKLGAEVRYATADGSSVRFDPLCNAMAVVEGPRFRSLRSLRRHRSELRDLVDLRRLEAAGTLGEWLDGVDAVVVPGGHGATFARFVADPLVGRVLARIHDSGGVVGLVCHAVLAGALARRADGQALLDGHEVTCWPAVLEAPLARLPGIGRYLAPFEELVEDGVKRAAARTWGGRPGELPVAVAHDRIVTSWGPWTAEAFARALAGALAMRTPPLRVAAPAVDRGEVERGRTFTNWANNFSCRPDVIAHPASLEQVVAVVERAAMEGRTVRPVGSAYSYTRLVETDAALVSLDRLTGLEAYDPERGVVRVRAGTPLWALWPELARLGLALPTAGDIDRQTVAGLIATATHGTGLRCGSFSSLVRGLTLVDGQGRVRHVTDPETLRFAACSLGSFGIVTSVELAVVPRYHLKVSRWADSLLGVADRIPELLARHRNFELFWFPGTDVASCKSMDLCDPTGGSARGFGRWLNEMVVENGLGWAASEALHQVPAIQRGLHAIAPHVVATESTVRPAEDAYATPRLVKHQEVEYALPLDQAATVLRKLDAMVRHEGVPTIFPVEVRFAPGEDVPLSPAYRRDTVWLAAHTYVKEDHRAYFARCEDLFLAHGGRPHWGKLHRLDKATLAGLYPEMAGFRAMRDRFDPERRFGSPYLEKVIG